MTRNAELDRLRAVAALMTVYTHYSQVFYPWSFTMEYTGPRSPLDMLGDAWTGVDLFFVISGYIISKTIVDSFDARRGDRQATAAAVIAFYVRRFFRIYPVAWLTLVGLIFAAAWLNDGGYFASVVDYLRAAASIFTYSFNYWYPDNKLPKLVPVGPYWSLSVEEQFYLLYPLFLLTVKATRRRVGILVGALALITFCVRPLSSGNLLHQFFYTQTRCDGLIYGCLLYFATTQPWFALVRRCAAAGQRTLRVAFVVICLIIAVSPTMGFTNTLTVPIACVLSTFLVALSACEVGAISLPAPVRQVLDYAGRRSYTIYLIHLPLFYLTCELMFRYCRSSGIKISPLLKLDYLLTFLSLLLVFTEVIYRALERPMIARGRRIASHIQDSVHGLPESKRREPERSPAGTLALPATEGE